jgi:hypothetical protein
MRGRVQLVRYAFVFEGKVWRGVEGICVDSRHSKLHSFGEEGAERRLTPMVDDAPPIELARAVTLPVPGLGMAPLSEGALICD